MSSWLVPRTELTPDQIRAVELDPNEHRVICGAPGSGKTQILLHRARYLTDRFQIEPHRLRIFVYTNVLKDYIRSALDLLELPDDVVSTFDYFVVDYYEKHISRLLPRKPAETRPDFARIRLEVLRALRLLASKARIFDCLLVDEGQDLDGVAFDLLRAFSKHVTVCLDHKQQIYEHGSNEAAILKGLGLKKRNLSLLSAFRCCPFVVNLAAEFIDDADEKSAYINQARMPQVERETPLLYYSTDLVDEKRRLIEMLRIRLAKGERIGVLLPQKKQVFGVAEGMRAAGLEVETPDDMDFSSDLPKILTYHSAKGLTFDTVLLPRLVPGSFPGMNTRRIERLLFVAISRATKWVYMSTKNGSDFPILERLRSVNHRQWLTIQEGGLLVQPVTATPAQNDLLDLL